MLAPVVYESIFGVKKMSMKETSEQSRHRPFEAVQDTREARRASSIVAESFLSRCSTAQVAHGAVALPFS